VLISTKVLSMSRASSRSWGGGISDADAAHAPEETAKPKINNPRIENLLMLAAHSQPLQLSGFLDRRIETVLRRP
jgi:hypothetical protein